MTRIHRSRWYRPYCWQIVYHDQFSYDENQRSWVRYNPEFIGVNDTAPIHIHDHHVEKCLSSDILYNLNPDFSPAFQDTGYRIFLAAPRLQFPFLLPQKYDSSISISPERINEGSIRSDFRLSEQIEEIVKNGIGEIALMGCFSKGGIQLKKFYCN